MTNKKHGRVRYTHNWRGTYANNKTCAVHVLVTREFLSLSCAYDIPVNGI